MGTSMLWSLRALGLAVTGAAVLCAYSLLTYDGGIETVGAVLIGFWWCGWIGLGIFVLVTAFMSTPGTTDAWVTAWLLVAWQGVPFLAWVPMVN